VCLLSPIATAALAFALILAGTIVGTLVRAKMPEHHLTGDSKEVIRLATALVATLTGLVLALMFAATRTSFEHTSSAVSRLAVEFSELDEMLEDYGGPDVAPIRRQLRADMGTLIDSIWQEEAAGAGRPPVTRKSHGVGALSMIRELQPKTPIQVSIQARALQVSSDIAQTRLARPAAGFGVDTLHRRARAVVDIHLHDLRDVVQAEPDADRRAGCLYPLGFRGALPHSRARPTV
jgi:hypothetical protein